MYCIGTVIKNLLTRIGRVLGHAVVGRGHDCHRVVGLVGSTAQCTRSVHPLALSSPDIRPHPEVCKSPLVSQRNPAAAACPQCQMTAAHNSLVREQNLQSRYNMCVSCVCVCVPAAELCGVGLPFAPEQSETKKRADVRGRETDQHHVHVRQILVPVSVGPLKSRK